MPFYQRLVRGVVWVLVPLLLAGALLDSVTNSIALVTPKVTYIGTGVLLVVWLGVEVLLRRRGVDWRQQGQQVRHRRLGPKSHCAFVGCLILLWVPRFVSPVEENAAATEKNAAATEKRVAGESSVTQSSHGAQSPNISRVGGDVKVQYGDSAAATPQEKSSEKKK